MSLETRILAFINAVGVDVKALYEAVANGGGAGAIVRTTVVNFTTAKNSQSFSIADTAVLATSKVSATLNLRADTIDNSGDDMDDIQITCKAELGIIIIMVTHNDAKQKLFGSFSINYTIN
jgi:hypothetical protein